MERKLYSLEAINSKNKTDRYVVKVKGLNGNYENKTYLSNIDKHIMTYFNSLDQFLYYLKKKEIIADKYDDLKITYRHNGVCAIDLVFNNENLLKKVAENSKTEIDISKCKSEFKFVFDTLIKFCDNRDFLNLINKGNQIPNHLKDRLNQLSNFIDEGTNEDAFHKKEIKTSIEKMLKSYKVFRTVYLYIMGYINNKEVNLQSTLLPLKKNIEGQIKFTDKKDDIIDYDREEKEEFLSEEELEESYLDSQPKTY